MAQQWMRSICRPHGLVRETLSKAKLFAAKDALMVVDDFAPSGTRNEKARLHREAARLIRAQGNSAGRSRMRPDGSLRLTKPPRGMLLSTGEDVPEGQSIKARLVVVEVEPNDVDFDKLSLAQNAAKNGLYAQAMVGYICRLAGDLDNVRKRMREISETLRDEARSQSCHRRTAWAVGELGAALKIFLRFAVEAKAISQVEADAYWHRCWDALLELAGAQELHQAASDPATPIPGIATFQP